MLFEEIYELHFKDVYRFLCGLTKDEQLAEELVQETFFKALKAIDRFDGSQDIRAWLFTIARNSFYSYCRSHKITVPVEDIADDIPSSIHLEDQLINEEYVLSTCAKDSRVLRYWITSTAHFPPARFMV